MYHLAENTTDSTTPQSFCCWWRVCGAANFQSLEQWRDSRYGDRTEGRDSKNASKQAGYDMKCAKEFADKTGHIGAAVTLKAIRQKIWADFSKRNHDQPFPTYTLNFPITPDTAGELVRFSKVYVVSEECEAAFAEKTGEEEDEEMEKDALEEELEQLRASDRDHQRMWSFTPDNLDEALVLKEEVKTLCEARLHSLDACISAGRKRKERNETYADILDELMCVMQEGGEDDFGVMEKHLLDRPRTKFFRVKAEDENIDVSSIFGST